MRRLLAYAVLAGLAIVIGSPILMIAVTSFTPAEHMFTETPRLFPPELTLQWYAEALKTTPIGGSILNSLLIALGTVAIDLTVAALAGYSLSRFSFPGKWLLSRLVILTYMFPPILLVLPLYLIMTRAQLVNTHVGVILTHTTFTLPFSIWLLRGYFDTIPLELDECAMLDGASRVAILLHIVAPLGRAGLAAVAVYTYLLSWNEYLYASVLMTSNAMKTLPVKIAEFIVETSEIRWGVVMAAAVLAIVPATAVFRLAERAFVKGLATGALKG